MKPRFFPSNRRVWACIIVGVLSLSCVWSIVAPYWQLRNEYQIAVQRWEQKQPRHYKYEAIWKGVLFQVEVQDGQVVQVIDLSANQPPEPFFWSYAEEFVVINQLFKTIETIGLWKPPSGAREYISRTYPKLVSRLASYGIPTTLWAEPCVIPLPTVRYNTQWAFPEYVIFRIHTCAARALWDTRDEEMLTLRNFQPLP